MHSYKSPRTAAIALLVLTAATMTPLQASLFNFATDFSVAANPHDGYTYGYSSTANGVVTPFTLGQTFSSSPDVGYGGFPYVYGNTSGTTFSSGTVQVPPLSSGYLVTHPASDGTYAVISYQLPTGGTLQFSANFSAQDVGGTSTDVHVLLNGSELFSGAVTGGIGTLQSYQTPLNGLIVSSGDILAVSVGNGGNNYFNDSTGVSVIGSVTPVPEPAEAALVAAVLLGGFAVWRHGRKP